MPIILPARWQYVYWITFLCFYILLVEGFRIFVAGPINTTVVTFVTILCVSLIATYIDKKIMRWGIWNVVHTTENKWKCLQCGNTVQSKFDVVTPAHEIIRICIKLPTDEALPGCGKSVSICTQNDHHVQTDKNGKDYRVCGHT